MSDKIDHSRRLATVRMSIEAATRPGTPGRALNYSGLLREALYFNLGRNPTFGAESRRTVAQEDLLEQATAIGLDRTASCTFVYYSRNVERWCLAEAQRRRGALRAALARAPALPEGTTDTYTLPALEDLQRLLTLYNRLWTYLALLEARAGGAIHGHLGALAEAAFVPCGANKRQSNLSTARKARARLAAQMDQAMETGDGNPLSAFLGRFENRFRAGTPADAARLLDFLADDLQDRPAASIAYPEAWAALKALAAHNQHQRQWLLEALRTFEEACRGDGPLAANNPLEAWLRQLPEQPDHQHPPARVLAYLMEITPEPMTALAAVAETAADPWRRDRLHAQLARDLGPGTWQASLVRQLHRDCSPGALLVWARDHGAAAEAQPDAEALRGNAGQRVELWASYAAAGGRATAPAGRALLELEIPPASAAHLQEAGSVLAAGWPEWSAVSGRVRAVIEAALLSVRLDEFAFLVGEARNAIGGGT